MRIEFSKISLGLGWLEATSYGACALRLSDPVLVASQLHGAATGGIGDSFVLLPRVLWCGVPFARAFPPREATYGRLVCYHSAYITRGFGVLGVFCARFPPREASIIFFWFSLVFL